MWASAPTQGRKNPRAGKHSFPARGFSVFCRPYRATITRMQPPALSALSYQPVRV